MLPTGRGWAGTPESESDAYRRPDEVRRRVRMTRQVFMQTTEVTNRAYREFDPTHDSGLFDSSLSNTAVSANDPDFPVVRVSQGDARRYCEWLTSRDPHFVYRLPTEAEWEWACRAGESRCRACELTTETANWNGRGTMAPGQGGPELDRAAAVGSYPPNAWGLHDLQGNVYEWCADVYRAGPSAGAAPAGGTEGEPREYVVRGGAWTTPVWQLRCAHRWHQPPETRQDSLGFRVVAVPRVRIPVWPASAQRGASMWTWVAVSPHRMKPSLR